MMMVNNGSAPQVDRFLLYAAASAAVTAGLGFYAWHTRVQFFPAVVYLSTSKISIILLTNMMLVLTLLFGRTLKSFFLGTLRVAEVEILYENSRFAITETCLALTIFRDELTVRVFVLFTALIFSKIFHWLAESRQLHYEVARESRLAHLRLSLLLCSLLAVDLSFTALSVHSTVVDGVSVMLLFGFEYLGLAVNICSIMGRYILHWIEQGRFSGHWPNRSIYLTYIEILAEVVRLFVYIVFQEIFL